MTIRAADFRVQTAKGESGLAMIELGDCANRLPSLRRMAVLARDIQFPVRTMGLFLRRLSAIGREHTQMQNYQQLRQYENSSQHCSIPGFGIDRVCCAREIPL